MKALKIITLFCFIMLFGKAQNSFDNYYKTGFENVLSSNPLLTEDSNVVILNYIIDSATGRQDVGFLKLNKLGNVIAQKSFNLYNKDHLGFIRRNNFIEATKCSFFLAGTTQGTNQKAEIVITKVNRYTLDTIKVRIYKDPNYYFSMNNLVKLNDDKYFLIGNRSTATNFTPIIYQLDSNLTITNTISISGAPANYGLENVVWNPINKKIVFQGKIFEGQRPITMLYTDTVGIVSNTSTSVSSFTTSLVRLHFSLFDSSFVCTGARIDSIYGNNKLNKLTVCKFDKNLNMLWLKTFGEEALYNGLWDAVILNDGSIVCSGSYSKLTSLPMTNMNQNGVILKVDKKGNLVWMREYDHEPAGNNWECFYGIEKTKEGGFVAAGNIVNMPKAKAWVVKTDSEGCVIPACASSTITVDSISVPPPTPLDTSTVGIKKIIINTLEWYMYPNPANELVYFSLKQTESHKTFLLKLVDISGKELESLQLEANRNVTLLTSKYEAGLYFVSLYSEKLCLETKKLIIVR